MTQIKIDFDKIMNKRGGITVRSDHHIHMVLDGVNWKAAIARHAANPDEGFIRQALAIYTSR